jgi:hypothetical protein
MPTLTSLASTSYVSLSLSVYCIRLFVIPLRLIVSEGRHHLQDMLAQAAMLLICKLEVLYSNFCPGMSMLRFSWFFSVPELSELSHNCFIPHPF